MHEHRYHTSHGLLYEARLTMVFAIVASVHIWEDMAQRKNIAVGVLCFFTQGIIAQGRWFPSLAF